MNETKCLKPSGSGPRVGDRACAGRYASERRASLIWDRSSQVRYCQGEVGKSPVFAPVSEVRAQLYGAARFRARSTSHSAPFMTAAPTSRYRGSTKTASQPLKARCCLNTPAREIPRSIYERARDVTRSLARTATFEQSSHHRRRIEMRFAHLKRTVRLGRTRLRGPRGAQDEFVLAAIAQNLRRLAKLVTKPSPLPVLA